DAVRRRVLARGATPDRGAARSAEAARERAEAVSLGYDTVVNDDLDRAVAAIAGMLAESRP
ncbi:MAG: guanylate kinase, partial [Actinomycetota bacterium]|nr:guanylate kinase [Actinomycetota bacterium]